MKVALVHDYLYDYGGAERVLEAEEMRRQGEEYKQHKHDDSEIIF